MMIRTIAVASIALVGTLTAQAQTPDKLCEGLDQMIKGAAEPSPFSSLALNSKQGRNPAGMEGAYACKGNFNPTKGAGQILLHGFDCLWIFPGTPLPALGSASSISGRAKACLAPPWTASAPREDQGAHVQTFTRTGSGVVVTTTEGKGEPNGHSADIMIIALP